MRQNMKKVICMAAVGALTLVSVIGDNVTSEAAAKTKKIVMNKKKVTLEAGKSFKPGFSERMTRIPKWNRLKPLILLPFFCFFT